MRNDVAVGSQNLIEVLRQIEQGSRAAASDLRSEGELAKAYLHWRAAVDALNREHGWANPDDFATQLPTVEALWTMRGLDAAFSGTRDDAGDAEVRRGILKQALRDLSWWATGTRSAHETFGREGDSQL